MEVKIQDVANWFFINSNKNLSSNTIQILCYYAYVYYLAINDKKLFEAEFQAWIHCPTCVELKESIVRDESYTVININNSTEVNNVEVINFLKEVLEHFGKFNRYDLEDSVCQCYAYNVARHGFRETEACYNIIKDSDIIIEYRFSILKNYIINGHNIEQLAQEINNYFSKKDKKYLKKVLTEN